MWSTEDTVTIFTLLVNITRQIPRRKPYQGGAVSATPTSIGAADALATPVTILPVGELDRPLPMRGAMLPSTDVGGIWRSDNGGDGVLLRTVSRGRTIGGAPTRCLLITETSI